MTPETSFLRKTQFLLTFLGGGLAIVHGIGMWTPYNICSYFALPLWADLPYVESASFMFNIALCITLIGLAIGLQNRIGWWMIHLLSSVLLGLFWVFGWASWMTVMKNWGISDHPITGNMVQSFVCNTAFFALTICWMLYMLTTEVRRSFGYA